jgi:hypothetical protein
MNNEHSDALVHLIEQRFAQAVNAHTALTSSVLGTGRIVQPMQITLTYAEGQLVELGHLHRIVRRLGQVSRPVALRVLEDDIRHWRSVYARHVDAEKPSMVSLAYSNGALEAAESALIAVQMSGRPEEDGRSTQ